MTRWAKFLERHPHPHLVVGGTQSVVRWRDNALLQLIETQGPSGRFAFKRDFDQERARYLVLVAFENEADAIELSEILGAEKADEDSRYASKREFDFDSVFTRKLTAVLKRRKSRRPSRKTF